LGSSLQWRQVVAESRQICQRSNTESSATKSGRKEGASKKEKVSSQAGRIN